MDYFFMFFGKFICHQLEERSFFVALHQIFLCARCTGIYIGIFSSFIYLFIRKRLSGNRPVSVVLGILILLCMAPLAIDGVSSYFLGRATTNIIRLITGIMFGSGLPILYVMLFNFNAALDNNRFVIKNNYELGLIMMLAFFISLLIFLNLYVAWLALSLILCISIIFSFFSILSIFCKIITSKMSRSS